MNSRSRRMVMALVPYLKDTRVLEVKVEQEDLDCWAEAELLGFHAKDGESWVAKVRFISDSEFITKKIDLLSLALVRPKQPRFSDDDIVQCKIDRQEAKEETKINSSFGFKSKEETKMNNSWDRFDAQRWVRGRVISVKDDIFTLFVHQQKQQKTQKFHISKLKPLFFLNTKLEYLHDSIWWKAKVLKFDVGTEEITLEVPGLESENGKAVRCQLSSSSLRHQKSWVGSRWITEVFVEDPTETRRFNWIPATVTDIQIDGLMTLEEIEIDGQPSSSLKIKYSSNQVRFTRGEKDWIF